jgi:tRNA (guanine37-N1)-methyltransferase
MKKAKCLRTPKRLGEKTLTLASKLGILDRQLEIQRDEQFIYIPLANGPSREQLKTLKEQVAESTVTVHSFPERKKTAKSLVQLLGDQLPPHLLASLPRALDFVGDLAIIELPPELDPYRQRIGEAILKGNKKICTVLAKAGPVGGTYRLREFTVIAGEARTETVHKEYGCLYYVDLAKAYYSPRLSFEHRRVASLVKDGETVIDLFAGVGPFSVQIAKSHQKTTVYAVDMNPDAVKYLEKNIRVNRVTGKVHPILGDARQVVNSKLSGIAERAIMNLPERAIEFVDAACKTIKPQGGTVHFYGFIKESDSLENLRASFAEAVEKSGRNVEKVLFSRLVRETAPYEWQAVLDVRIG